MGDRAFAHFPYVSGDPGRTADRRCERRDPNRWSNPQSAGKSDRRSHESSHLLSDVAVRGFSRHWGRPIHHCSVAWLSFRRAGCSSRLGPVVAEPQVAYAVLQPGPGWSGAELFVAETLSMAFIVLLVGVCLAAPRLAPFVPWIVGVAIGTAIATLGTSTGGSVNPARQFGPAILSGQTRFLWVYLLAPMVGAMIATWLRQRAQRRGVLTHRLCGTQRDGRPLSESSPLPNALVSKPRAGAE
jgi:hypothetical protein